MRPFGSMRAKLERLPLDEDGDDKKDYGRDNERQFPLQPTLLMMMVVLVFMMVFMFVFVMMFMLVFVMMFM